MHAAIVDCAFVYACMPMRGCQCEERVENGRVLCAALGRCVAWWAVVCRLGAGPASARRALTPSNNRCANPSCELIVCRGWEMGGWWSVRWLQGCRARADAGAVVGVVWWYGGPALGVVARVLR